MMKYPWAANREKLERAIGVVGHSASEDEVKAEYIRIAGLVLNDDGTKGEVKATPASVVEEVVEVAGAQVRVRRPLDQRLDRILVGGTRRGWH